MTSNKMKMVLVEVWNVKKEKRIQRHNIFFYGIIATREEKIESAINQVKAMYAKIPAYVGNANIDYRHHVGNQ